VIYVGRVVHVEVAEAILGAGQRTWSVWRATIGGPAVGGEGAGEQREQIRPCIVVNDCINRRSGGLAVRVRVEPDAGREYEGQAGWLAVFVLCW
jgi:hypothetical protein